MMIWDVFPREAPIITQMGHTKIQPLVDSVISSTSATSYFDIYYITACLAYF